MNKLLSWINGKSKDFQLELEEHLWPSKWLGECYSFKVRITIGNDQARGSGVASDKVDALTTAVAEALERYLFKISQFKSTNGLAVYPSEAECIRRASFELVERDLFFCHYLTKTPFIRSEFTESFATDQWQQFVATCKEHGVKVELRELQKNNIGYGMICLAQGANTFPVRFGATIGLGFGENKYDAAFKAVKECAAQVAFNIDGDISTDGVSIESFSKQTHWNVEDQRKWTFNPDSVKGIAPLFMKDGVEHEVKCFSVETKQVHWPIEYSDIPLKAYRAYSSEMQGLFFGPVREEILNIRRLSKFTGQPITVDRLQHFPHPLV